MRFALASLFGLCVFVVAPISARAMELSASDEALPKGVFRMSDGKYYDPSRGILTANLQELVSSLSSTSTTTPLITASSTDAVSVQPFPLKRAIQRGRQMIQQVIEQQRPSTPRLASSDDGWRHVTLAIWNPRTDDIRLVRVLKKGRQLRSEERAERLSVSRSNGVNSEFVVAGTAGEMVVAIQYPIYAEKVLSKKKKRYEIRDVVYTPYSQGLHTPEMIQEGKRWFDALMMNVFEQLRADHVVSLAFPDKLLADVIDPSFVERLTIIEHLDDTFMRQNPERKVEAFYATLAANEDQAYSYSKSKAGALGLVQFIPKTYLAFAKLSHLRLHPDFESGMRDPKNAIRAQIIYLDYLLSRLPDEVRASSTMPAYVEEVLAASYNGGATRVARAMVVWEENFDPQQRLQVKTRSRLKLETMKYVLKLRALRDRETAVGERRSMSHSFQ